ncbi:MAG: restriction endonuclease subunit S [Prolixibacteraceae bacterium]|nr:restriction endonuclease subunit S [Prolixibacteraceae bacterium]
MNKATNKLIPELRFPEFVKDGEWVEKVLIDTADKKVKWSFTGGPFGSNLMASDYTANGIRIIQLQNIGDGEFMDKYKIYTSEEKANELLSCNIYSGEIILSKMGDPVGRACIIPDNLIRCVMASDGIRLVVDEKKCSKYFIYSLINSKQIREAIEKKATGSTRKRIGLDELREIELIIPRELNEQQKIASCLSSLDEVIAAHSQKLEALKTHKKGLMQNLFPQEGETVPKWRFKEFADDGEWVEKMLESFCLNLSSGKDKNTMDGEYELYGSTGIIGRTDNASYDGDFILIARVGANAGLLNRAKGKFGVTDNTLVIDLKESEYIDFVFYSLERFGLNKLVFGSGQPLITGGQLKSLNMKIPKSEKEQQKIAECLFSLDALITAQAKKIEQLKLHKKGLMQGLFPGMSEL